MSSGVKGKTRNQTELVFDFSSIFKNEKKKVDKKEEVKEMPKGLG